jgi:hypothetical protein
MANDVESSSQHSSHSESSTLTPTSLDLLLPPSLEVNENIRSWAQTTSVSTGISASANSPASSSTLISRNKPSSTMSALSEAPYDDSSLGESAYDFIDTDEESRDGNATESVASTDFGRPDEVASLADTERSGEESGEDEEQAATSLREVDHAREPLNSSTKLRSSTVVLDKVKKPLIQSIEFEEPFTLGTETISVKHTVAEFNEEQTTTLVRDMALQSPPKRLAVTIRQTMTKQGLSTRDPLRILYVGSHSAKQDIIHKIASSVTASVDSGNPAKHLRQFPSQLYNVVPVSAFGSERTPEIELMHSSGYQIKVEDCISARNLKFEDLPEKPDVIKLTLDDAFSYHSVPEGQGFIVEPHWELPHVGIIYCSDNDDAEARRTMTATRKFMGRHGVPSIVISHKQLFDRGQCMSLDQHSIHMCLESRDPNGRGNIIHRRLPIDLASFLNIDARQMNRNLAYITGLHETLPVPTPSVTLADSQDLEKTPHNMSSSFYFIRNRSGAEWRALLPVGVLLLSVFAAVFTGIPSYRFSSAPAMSINSKVMSPVPISTTSTASTVQATIIESTATSTAVKTSTRTITVIESQSSGPNSLAVLPSMELGSLSPQVPSPSKPDNKCSVCAAEILGDREILIRIPSATKLSWLTKEALSVNITRGNETVDTERAYSSDDGIILLLAKNQAYGVLNISVITTKKPRINETFQVDFGTTIIQTWQTMMGRMSSLLDEEMILLDLFWNEKMRSMVTKFVDDTQVQSQSTLAQVGEAGKIALEHTVASSARLAHFFKEMSLGAVKHSAIISKEITIKYTEIEAKVSEKMKTLERLRGPIENGLLKAQVQSKLLWLKLQGKDEEYRKYQARAAEATPSWTKYLKKVTMAGAKDEKKVQRAAKKVEKKEAQYRKKAGKKVRT